MIRAQEGQRQGAGGAPRHAPMQVRGRFVMVWSRQNHVLQHFMPFADSMFTALRRTYWRIAVMSCVNRGRHVPQVFICTGRAL